jgi:hypothetical protein
MQDRSGKETGHHARYEPASTIAYLQGPVGWHYRMVNSDEGSPLMPVYPFNKPNQPISLYAGHIGGLGPADVPGTVELSCTPTPSLDWTVRPGATPPASGSQVTLLLRRPDGDMQVPGWVRGTDIEQPDGTLSSDGWSNGAVFGRGDAPLNRIIVHWFNLPRWHGPIPLSATTEDGTQWQWAGRWVLEADGWRSLSMPGPTTRRSGVTFTRRTPTS